MYVPIFKDDGLLKIDRIDKVNDLTSMWLIPLRKEQIKTF